MGRFIELRTYTLKTGLSGHFHQLMQGQAVPLLRAAGTEVVVARPSLHTPDAYLLIRAYPGLEQRSRSQDQFYGSAAWLQGPRDPIMACIEHYTTAVIEADDALVDSLRHSEVTA